jgi:hypothetical protein
MAAESFEHALPLTLLGKLNAEFFADRESSPKAEPSAPKSRSRREHV